MNQRLPSSRLPTSIMTPEQRVQIANKVNFLLFQSSLKLPEQLYRHPPQPSPQL